MDGYRRDRIQAVFPRWPIEIRNFHYVLTVLKPRNRNRHYIFHSQIIIFVCDKVHEIALFCVDLMIVEYDLILANV